jgi:hypothetical protein
MSNLLKRNSSKPRRPVQAGPTGQAHATLCRVAAVSLAQVRFCRYRFSPTGAFGYRGIMGGVKS